jgi:hypothetical protein
LGILQTGVVESCTAGNKKEFTLMKINRHCDLGKVLFRLNSLYLGRAIAFCFPKVLRLLVMMVVVSVALVPLSATAKTCEQWVAKIASVEGRVEAKRAGDATWQQVKPGETFCPGDMIRVGEESRAQKSKKRNPALPVCSRVQPSLIF